MQVARAAGDQVLMWKARHNLAYADFLAGRLPRALAAMEEAEDALGRDLHPIGRLDRARVLREAGLVRDADLLLARVAEELRARGLHQDVGETELVRAECALVEGEADLARRLARRAERFFERRGNLSVAAPGAAGAAAVRAEGRRRTGAPGAAGRRCGSSPPGPGSWPWTAGRSGASTWRGAPTCSPWSARCGPARRRTRRRRPAAAGPRPAPVPAARAGGPDPGRAAPRGHRPGRGGGTPRAGRAGLLPERVRLPGPANRQRGARSATRPARSGRGAAQRQPGGVLRGAGAGPGRLHPAGAGRAAQ